MRSLAHAPLALLLALCAAARSAHASGSPTPGAPPAVAPCTPPEPAWPVSPWWPSGAQFRCGCGLTAGGTASAWNDPAICSALGDLLYATGAPQAQSTGQGAPYTFFWRGWPLRGWSNAVANISTDYCSLALLECSANETGVANNGGKGVPGFFAESANLTGVVPPSLAALAALPGIIVLSLPSNPGLQLDPALLAPFSGLRMLSLTGVQLTGGSLPVTWGGLTQLTALSLDSTGLVGSLPAVLGSLTALGALGMSDNALQGGIPAEWGSLTALQSLSLARNELSGTLSADTLCAMSALTLLDVSVNALSGSIPSLTCPVQLMYLDLRSNTFTGA